MNLTGILKLPKKTIVFWLFTFLLCGSIAYAAYQIAPSKMEGEWQQVRRSVTKAAEWNTYQVEEIVKGDGIEQLYQNGKVQQYPKQSYFDVRININDTETFAFEAYLLPEQIYLHNKNEGNWVDMDYSNPTAGELIGMTSPIKFWLVLLMYVDKVDKKIVDGKIKYEMSLRPFLESVHGITFKGEGAKMEVWADKATGRLLEANLQAKSSDVLNDFKKVEYTIKFRGANQTTIPEPPSRN